MRPLGWALNRSDYCPYKKRKFDMEKRRSEDTGRRRPSVNQERLQEKPSLLTPYLRLPASETVRSQCLFLKPPCLRTTKNLQSLGKFQGYRVSLWGTRDKGQPNSLSHNTKTYKYMFMIHVYTNTILNFSNYTICWKDQFPYVNSSYVQVDLKGLWFSMLGENVLAS